MCRAPAISVAASVRDSSACMVLSTHWRLAVAKLVAAAAHINLNLALESLRAVASDHNAAVDYPTTPSLPNGHPPALPVQVSSVLAVISGI